MVILLATKLGLEQNVYHKIKVLLTADNEPNNRILRIFALEIAQNL